MPDKPPKHVVDYFRRGQVLFLVDGDEWDDATSPQQVINWARPVTAEKRVTLDNFRSVRFPTVDELLSEDNGSPDTQEPPPQESLPPLEVEGPGLSLEKSEKEKPYTSPEVEEQGLFTLVAADVPELAEIPEDDPQDRQKLPTKLSHDASKLLNVIRSLDEIRESFPVGTLQVVTPNWLVSGGKDSQPGGTGGPGAKPMAADGPADTQAFKFNLPKEILEEIGEGTGENVVVAILDTAPKNSVDNIYQFWVTDRPNDPHPLIRSLLDPANRRLTIHPRPSVDDPIPNVKPAQYIQADGHDYEMSDHGLFVAGIIHSVAPNSKLELYQVLNRYGVGDLLSIADALLDVYVNFAPGQLLLNLSLTINIPLERAHFKNSKNIRNNNNDDEDDDDMGRALLKSREEEEKDENSWSKRQKMAAERICALAYKIGSRVIAAAGNNRKKKKDSPRPQACYPAALDSVLGVGALPKSEKPQNSNKKLKTTSYSNRSDRPERVGITTLGGEEGKGDGILGIYLEGFPRDEDPAETNPATDPSLNGWGWWAGTSFATPIITGITAAVLSNMPGSTTEEAIAKLFRAQNYETDDNEDVLFVTQGL
jgi:hypothetical protein